MQTWKPQPFVWKELFRKRKSWPFRKQYGWNLNLRGWVTLCVIESSCKKIAWKKSGLNGNQAHDLMIPLQCSYQLSYQSNSEQVNCEYVFRRLLPALQVAKFWGVFSQNESSTVHSLVGVRVRWLRAKHFCVWPNQTLSWRILSHNEFKTVYLSNCPARAGKYSLYSRAIWPFSAPLKKMRMAYMPSLLTQGFCRYFVWRVHTWLYGSFDE